MESIEEFDKEVEEYDAEKILAEARRMEKHDDKRTIVSEKARAEFKRVPNYSPRKCYKFDVVCSQKCIFWNDCTKRGK